MSYHHLYDSALLDDIHNYFPQILYAPERFRSVPDVLAYVQQQVRERFDLFTRGRREFLERDRRAQTSIISTPPLRPTSAAGISMLFEASRANSDMAANEFLNAINLMNGLLTSSPPPLHLQSTAGFMEPVVVRPTAQQIESASAIEIIDSDEEMCAICQDQMPAGTEALNLNACDHRFHSTCIRTWFTGNVICPVCRHDIREPAVETP